MGSKEEEDLKILQLVLHTLTPFISVEEIHEKWTKILGPSHKILVATTEVVGYNIVCYLSMKVLKVKMKIAGVLL